ncbi:hypothetical protein [Streptomyces albidoflavus]|uniref:hypothetical protein n=1 Tax=Streptomyces albidoflavus TaxID=1886 RepID=UPI003327882A
MNPFSKKVVDTVAATAEGVADDVRADIRRASDAIESAAVMHMLAFAAIALVAVSALLYAAQQR